MSTKVLKYISVCVLVLAFGVFGTAQAAVTVGTTSVTSNGALTLTGATASNWTTSAGALTLTAAEASTWSTSAGVLTLTGTGGLTLDSGTTTAVNLGTGAAAKTITIGNAASTEAEINALLVDINAGATGMTIDFGAGNLAITGAGASADFTLDADLISIDGTGTSNITVTGAAGEDFTIAQAGAADASLFLSSTGTGSDALTITVSGASGDIQVDATAGTVIVDGGEAVADALLLRATGGTLATAHLTSNGTGASAVDIDATGTGGDVDIDANDAIDLLAGGVFSIDGTGASNVSATSGNLTLSTITTGVLILSSAGNTTLDVAAGGLLSVDVAAPGIEVATANNISVAASDSAGVVAQTLVIELTGAEDDEDDFTVRAVGANGDLLLTSGDDLLIDTVGLLELNSSAGVISIGNDAVNQNIGIGTAGTRTITIGSATTILNATAADGSLVDLSATVTTTAAAKGLKLPQKTDCSLGITEGHICWDTDNNVLYVGDGAAAAAVAGSTGAANTWTDNQIYTLAGDEDIAITHDAGAANILSITVTPNAVDNAVQAIKIDQAASANANGLDAAIEIDNSDDTAAITAGLLFTSAGGAITTAINASATQIVTALSVGDNPITGGTWNLNATAALTLGDVLTGTNAATVAIFSSDWEISTTGAITGVAFDANGTGNSLSNVEDGDLVADTLTFAAISDSSAVDADTTFTAADGITLTLTPTHTAGDANFLTIDANQTDDVNATDDFDVLRLDLTSESGDAGDTFDGIVVIWENGTANTIMDSALKIDNAETTVATMTDAIIVTSSGVDTGVTTALNVSDTNIVNAISVGDNIILGGAAVINFTGFDVAATTGATVIAGSAAGTAALTLSLGDLVLLDTDTTSITSVNGTTTVVLIDNAGGVQADNTSALLIDAGGNNASGSNMLRLAPTGTPVEGSVGIEFVGSAKVMQAMNIDGDSVSNSVVLFNGGGALADNKAVLEVTADGTMVAGSSLVRIASATAAGGATVYGLEISANAANLEGLWVSAGKVVFAEDLTVDTFVTADAYQVTNGAAFTAASNTPTKADLQAASFWPVNTATNAVDVDIIAMDAADIGRHLTFAVTTGHATQALTVTSGVGLTVVTINTLGTTAEDAGDYIECLITATATATCVVYAGD